MAQAAPISPHDMRRVSSGRWLMPILAMMSAENGSRFGALARSLGMSRSVLSRHLDLLSGFGWIVRNTGHGHPLRPEYLLTPAGRPIAAWCEGVMAQRVRLGLEQHDLGRWSLPVVARLRDDRQRFSQLQRTLAPITARALSLTLKQMLEVRLVDVAPAVALYGLTDRGRGLADALA